MCPQRQRTDTSAKITMVHSIFTHPEMIATYFDYCHQNDEFSVYITVADTDLEEDNVEVILAELEEFYDERAFWIAESTRGIREWNDRYDAGDASDDDLASYLKRNRKGVLEALTKIIRWRAESEAKEAARSAA